MQSPSHSHRKLARARLFRRRDPARCGPGAARHHRLRAVRPGRVELGRFHEQPVGPHPLGSYQLAFGPGEFSHVVGWLALNHGALDVFVHPNTGDALRDHRDCALWIGRSHVGALAG